MSTESMFGRELAIKTSKRKAEMEDAIVYIITFLIVVSGLVCSGLFTVLVVSSWIE